MVRCYAALRQTWRWSGRLIGPEEGRLAMQDLYQRAVDVYGAERVTAQGLLDDVGRCVAEGRFRYASAEAALVQAGAQPVAMDGYVGQPDLPPPSTHLIRLRGTSRRWRWPTR